MQLDFIANKHKLTLKYAAIAGADLHPIMEILMAQTLTGPYQFF
jgi:hypothetical protein